MRNRRRFAILAGAWLAGAVAASVPYSPPARADTIIYSNDVLGEIEPCGCRSNPLGGMARKSGLLKTLGDKSRIVVDSGDLFFATAPIPDNLVPQAREQARYLADALKLMGGLFATPGEKDFALGIPEYLKLLKRAGARGLAANLRRAKGNRLLDPYRIAKGSKYRVAILGLVSSDISWPEGLRATSPIEEAKRLVPRLRKQADLVIALTHEGTDDDRALAEAVPGIDAIIGAHSQSFLQQPEKAGGAFLFQSSFRNQYVGILPLTKPLSIDGHRLVGLDAGYDPPPASPMAKLVARFKAAVARANEKLDRETSAPPAKASFQTFPKCAQCHMPQFDFWRGTAHARALDPLVKAHQEKNRECLSCHTVGLDQPGGFHQAGFLGELDGGKRLSAAELAKLLSAMRELPKPATPPAKLARSWAPVQCENCHFPAAGHPFAAGSTPKVENSTCLKCHTAERAPEWYTKDRKPDWEKIAAKRQLITH